MINKYNGFGTVNLTKSLTGINFFNLVFIWGFSGVWWIAWFFPFARYGSALQLLVSVLSRIFNVSAKCSRSDTLQQPKRV